MPAISAWIKSEWRVILLIIVSASAQLFLVSRPLDFLITHLLPDDAFYYFEIARNIALGAGSTFDGLNPTNGYHPLWLLALVPIFSFFSTGGAVDIAPIHAALAMAVALNAVTAFFVSRILSRFTRDEAVRAVGLFVWLFNPFILYETVNGLETSFSLFFLALFFLLALRTEEGRDPDGVVLGASAGLMVLARLDLAVYFVAFLLWLLARHGWRQGVRNALLAGIVASAVVSPWFVWNIVHFGTPIPSSSVASTIVNHGLIVQDHGDSWLQTGKAAIYHSQYELDKLFERTGMYAIACAFFGAMIALLVLGHSYVPQRAALMTMTQAFAGAFLFLFLANAGVRWTVRSWYFVSFNVFLAILVVSVADAFLPYMRRVWRKRALAFLVLAIAFSFFVNWSKVQRHGMPEQREMHKAALRMNESLPEGSVIGVFNAGIQGYVSRHTVVNLDGLVNNAALDALRQKALWSYVKVSGIEYISDFPLYLTYRYRSFFGVEDVFDELVPLPEGESGGLSMWRVK